MTLSFLDYSGSMLKCGDLERAGSPTYSLQYDPLLFPPLAPHPTVEGSHVHANRYSGYLHPYTAALDHPSGWGMHTVSKAHSPSGEQDRENFQGEFQDTRLLKCGLEGRPEI